MKLRKLVIATLIACCLIGATILLLTMTSPHTLAKPEQVTASLTWTTRASMSTVRDGVGAAGANNGKIYAIGGWANGPLASVEEYDPATDTWRMRASMPTARVDHSAAMASNGKIYAISGDDGNPSAFTANEEYDPTTDIWTVRAGIPTPRYAFGLAAASNGKLYAIGGANNGIHLATVEEYNPATDTWTTRANMPAARAAPGVATASNGKIYAIGGTVSGDTFVATVEEYDPATNTWRARASMPTARARLGVVATSNGKLYAIGGYDSSGVALAVVEEYNPATDTWRADASMPTARYYFGVALGNNGKIYAIGGERAPQQHLAIVEEASFLSSQSLTLSITPPSTADVGNLVYIPISVTNVLTSDDLRGAQIGIQVNNTTVLTPASNLLPRLGGLFPTNSLTYSVALTNGWGFMLTSTVSPSAAISGSGVIVEFPFYARAEGCVALNFTDHLLTNSQAQFVDHQITAGQMCVWAKGNLKGTAYLQSRATGYFTGTLIALSGVRGTYTTTADATGNFTFTNIYSDTYTANFTHTLFVHAVRSAITVTGQTTTTMPEVGLWAGDMNQDGNVTAPDWYLCAAASIPVDDPAFDINSDQATDIRDCALLGSNIGRLNMSTTNPPKTGLAISARDFNRPAASNGIGRIVSVPLGNGDTLLRAVEVNGQIYATGTRLGLPAGATVTGVELRDGFAGGFLNWHQDGDNLYIVTAPRNDVTLTRDTDIAIIHVTNGGEAAIEASSSVGATRSIFLPLVKRS